MTICCRQYSSRQGDILNKTILYDDIMVSTHTHVRTIIYNIIVLLLSLKTGGSC